MVTKDVGKGSRTTYSIKAIDLYNTSTGTFNSVSNAPKFSVGYNSKLYNFGTVDVQDITVGSDSYEYKSVIENEGGGNISCKDMTLSGNYSEISDLINYGNLTCSGTLSPTQGCYVFNLGYLGVNTFHFRGGFQFYNANYLWGYIS